jgi:hypothetical protein
LHGLLGVVVGGGVIGVIGVFFFLSEGFFFFCVFVRFETRELSAVVDGKKGDREVREGEYIMAPDETCDRVGAAVSRLQGGTEGSWRLLNGGG